MTVEIWGYMGGAAEFKEAGSAEIDDEQTGQKKTIIWDNHIIATSGKRIAKLRRGHIIGICELMKTNKEFREFVEKCP